LLVTIEPNGMTIDLPPSSLALLGPFLVISLFAVWVVGCAATLFLTINDPQWIWALGMLLLFGLESVRIGIALVSRAVGRERLVIGKGDLRLERRALGRFGEDVEVPLADVLLLVPGRGGRTGYVMSADPRGRQLAYGRGLTEAEANWIARTLGARLPR